MRARIHDALVEALAPDVLEVANESHMHSVPANSETHFKVVIVAASFADQPLLARHRRVNTLLAGPLAQGVHALAIHAYTPEQWRARGGQFPASPPCRGGSRKH